MTIGDAAVTPGIKVPRHQSAEDAEWGGMSQRLIFLDNDLERDFRSAERSRNLVVQPRRKSPANAGPSTEKS